MIKVHAKVRNYLCKRQSEVITWKYVQYLEHYSINVFVNLNLNFDSQFLHLTLCHPKLISESYISRSQQLMSLYNDIIEFRHMGFHSLRNALINSIKECRYECQISMIGHSNNRVVNRAILNLCSHYNLSAVKTDSSVIVSSNFVVKVTNNCKA